MTPLLWAMYLIGFVTMCLPVPKYQAEVMLTGIGLQLGVVLAAV